LDVGSPMGRSQAVRKIDLLLVDSEDELRRSAARALEGRGFRVAQADGWQSALASLRKVRPDAVVLDVNGDSAADLGALAKLRAAKPKLPVVLLAEECEADIALRGLELGAVDVLHKPADIDQLGNRIRTLVASGAEAPREKTIAELMIPATAYARVYEDEPLRTVIKRMTSSVFRVVPGRLTERGHRTVLVFSRKEKFLGVIRLNDILQLIIPRAQREFAETCEPGMFVARCKVLGDAPAGELVGEQSFVEVDAPLMEAVQTMVVDNLINIPVLRRGNLVGVLTDRNLLLEMCQLATGACSDKAAP
jgi:DNA-binding response OmpR family regulator